MMVAVGGCASSGTGDPCKSISGACITAHIQGTATGLDQLRFIVTQPSPASTLSPTTPTPFTLPVKVGITPPAGAGDTFDLEVEGLSGGTAVASDEKTINIVNNRDSIIFTLNAGTAPDLAMPKVEVDMAEPPDMHSPPPITVTPTGVINAAELEPLAVPVVVTDPANQPLTATLTGLPMGAMPTADGGVQSLLWTPTFDQAGSYDVTVHVTPMNPARAFTQLFTIKVLNTLDPIFPNQMPMDTLTNAVPPPGNNIGDFDGDGFGDIATCWYSTTGTVGYTVNIVFGDATGLPTQLPIPAARTKQIQFNLLSSPSDNRMLCLGGDVNKDGKSDIILVDPAATSGEAGAGMIYIINGTDRASTPTISQAMDKATPILGVEKGLGTTVVVADVNNDGAADFFATNGANAGSDVIYKFFGTTTPGPTTAYLVPNTSDTQSISCGHRRIMAAGNVDGVGGDEVLVFDPGVAPCPAGGLRVIGFSGGTSYTRPAGTQPGWGGGGAPSTLCDVDGDGKADLVVADNQNGKFGWVFISNGGIFPSPSPNPLDLTKATQLPAGAGHKYALAACVKNFTPGSPQTALLADPGDQMTVPSRIDVLSQSVTPMVARSLPAPGMPPDPNFGSAFGNTGDVNGDGRGDIIIGALPAGAPLAAGKFWIYYGR